MKIIVLDEMIILHITMGYVLTKERQITVE